MRMSVFHLYQSCFGRRYYKPIIFFRWKSSHIAKPTLGSPTDHGWSWDDETRSYTPVMTNLSPAPESLVELSMSKCTKGNSKCKKVALCVQKYVFARTTRTHILI